MSKNYTDPCVPSVSRHYPDTMYRRFGVDSRCLSTSGIRVCDGPMHSIWDCICRHTSGVREIRSWHNLPVCFWYVFSESTIGNNKFLPCFDPDNRITEYLFRASRPIGRWVWLVRYSRLPYGWSSRCNVDSRWSLKDLPYGRPMFGVWLCGRLPGFLLVRHFRDRNIGQPACRGSVSNWWSRYGI